jgi:NAD(P)-dependent dehydrogenase (short-subunit alcohol dehydrogenase family)
MPLPGDDPKHGEVDGEMTRVWLITGAARGLGQAFTEAAVGTGDSVIATARTGEALDSLVSSHGSAVFPLVLDVTDRAAVNDAVAAGVEHFGRIDVLVNNAGYGLAGAVEELDEARVRAQFDVNVFGLLWCTQAVLPYMRAQGSGHIFQLSSLAAVNAPPNLGGYNASKSAVEAISESLSQEVESFGVKVTILEPGPFRSDWNGTSMDRAEPMHAYDEVLAERRSMLSGESAFTQPGDPARAAEALLAVLSSDHPPLRLLLGRRAADVAPEVYRQRLAEWAEWDVVARGADFDN